MNEPKRLPRGMWSQHDCVTAAEIWQTHFADHWGDDEGPRGARVTVMQRIAATIGRTFYGVEQRWLVHGPSFGANQRSRGAPEHALAQRDARKEACHGMSLTASIFGDPPPGYSALDKKREGVRR
jgi:hypothetical protein